MFNTTTQAPADPTMPDLVIPTLRGSLSLQASLLIDRDLHTLEPYQFEGKLFGLFRRFLITTLNYFQSGNRLRRLLSFPRGGRSTASGKRRKSVVIWEPLIRSENLGISSLTITLCLPRVRQTSRPHDYIDVAHAVPYNHHAIVIALVNSRNLLSPKSRLLCLSFHQSQSAGQYHWLR